MKTSFEVKAILKNERPYREKKRNFLILLLREFICVNSLSSDAKFLLSIPNRNGATIFVKALNLSLSLQPDIFSFIISSVSATSSKSFCIRNRSINDPIKYVKINNTSIAPMIRYVIPVTRISKEKLIIMTENNNISFRGKIKRCLNFLEKLLVGFIFFQINEIISAKDNKFTASRFFV
jgi:hypothetical protein